MVATLWAIVLEQGDLRHRLAAPQVAPSTHRGAAEGSGGALALSGEWRWRPLEIARSCSQRLEALLS
eukprot:12166113-Alexandrium_andersonii.AAC.1